MKNKYYTSRDPIKNYFPLPNEVFRPWSLTGRVGGLQLSDVHRGSDDVSVPCKLQNDW